MPQIHLEKLNDENREACLSLRIQAVDNGTLPGVESSLKQAEAYSDAKSFAVSDDSDQIVGFAQYGLDQESGHWKIYRLYIDQNYQGKGFGQATLDALVSIITETHGARTILIAYQSGNLAAHELYRKTGFEVCGRENDKTHAKLSISENGQISPSNQ